MTDVSRLKVSLTKHNAHKVARLLKEYKSSEVFERLDEVHANTAQARKNLSTLRGDALPAVWEKAQALGSDAIDALVLLAIVFSHRTLITAMAGASVRQGFSGRVERGNQLAGKAYTNFARIIDQLGYATKLEYRGVTFNLKGMFEIPGLGPLVGELLTLKLAEAKWDRSNGSLDEVVRLGFQDVFGVTGDELRAWLASGAQPAAADYDAHADRALGVKTFKVLQIPIKKGILVVPLDLQGDHAALKRANMIDLVRSRAARHVVQSLFDGEVRLGPVQSREGAP
jgi:hypothetical protein